MLCYKVHLLVHCHKDFHDQVSRLVLETKITTSSATVLFVFGDTIYLSLATRFLAREYYMQQWRQNSKRQRKTYSALVVNKSW